MIDTKVFDRARKKFFSREMLLLKEAGQLCMEKKPYQGIRILHNVPLTISTIFKIEMLALGGADITVTSIKQLAPDDDSIAVLKEANIMLQIEHDFKEDYDFHLDCCAQLVHFKPPKIGAVELTKTGSVIYKDKNCSYPLISVDDSNLKFIETFYGTGDGFTRALLHNVGSEILNKKFVIFGFGKVGQGIAYSLKKYTNNIHIVDSNETMLRLVDHEIHGCTNGKNFAELKKLIKDAYCVVTATGVKNVMSNYYQLKKADFDNAILTNMGGDDEYGDNFSPADVAYEKKPYNFSIPVPTDIKYLDPIFYAHNIGIDHILACKMKSGYHPYPPDLVKSILLKWEKIYNEKVLAIHGS
jgi:adenosylhomocysteinase